MSRPHLVLWWTLATALCQEDEQRYCAARYDRLCQGKGQHVGCQFPYRGRGEACENYTAIIFSDELKYFILHFINRRRQRLAAGHERVRGGTRVPRPEVMMLVQWDRELAFLAQRLADQCRFVHDDCRATVRYPYAGQTVGEVRWRRTGEALQQGARRSIGRVLDAWWGERRRVQVQQLTAPFVLTSRWEPTLTCEPSNSLRCVRWYPKTYLAKYACFYTSVYPIGNMRGAVWGHFSQLAVWTLRAMGCGAVHHGYAHPRLLLVCDFSHTNMLGQRTISPGPPAPCPRHTVRTQGSAYPSLCAPVHDYHDTPYHHDPYREHDVYETEEDERMVYTPRMRHTRPFSSTRFTSQPEDDEKLELQKEVESLARGNFTWFQKPEIQKFQADLRRQEGVLRGKLRSELDKRNQKVTNKAAYKIGISGAEDTRSKDEYTILKEVPGSGGRKETNRRPPSSTEHWTEESEEAYREVIPLRKLSTQEITGNEEESRTETLTAEQQFVRQRWKQPRSRPRRPGANALLHSPSPRRQQKASLLIDQDDAEQLFRDTGFKVEPSRRP